MQRRIIGIVLILAMMVSSLSFSASLNLNNVRVSKQAYQTRIVFHASTLLQYNTFTLKNPDRFVIDLKNTQALGRMRNTVFAGTPVSAMRYGKRPGNTLRLVFDVKKGSNLRAFSLVPSGGRGYRLVLDASGNYMTPGSKSQRTKQKTQFSKQSQKNYFSFPTNKPSIDANFMVGSTGNRKPERRQSATPASKVSQPKKNYAPQPIYTVQTSSKKKEMRNIIVVIDPGHGGKDPGATGPGGTHEKTVVLAISKDLQRLIDRQPGFVARLTRRGDYYLTLRQRLAIARRDKADMFIAIHADKWYNSKARGASIFALSQRGATSEAARWLAHQENKSELLGGVNLGDKSRLLRSVLINLSQTATIRQSLKMGKDILPYLRQVSVLHAKHVEQAAFVVLKSPDIPSLLVETGFLSNPREERNLRNPRFRERLAKALMSGIQVYFKRQPPPNTWLAYWKQHPRMAGRKTIIK